LPALKKQKRPNLVLSSFKKAKSSKNEKKAKSTVVKYIFKFRISKNIARFAQITIFIDIKKRKHGKTILHLVNSSIKGQMATLLWDAVLLRQSKSFVESKTLRGFVPKP